MARFLPHPGIFAIRALRVCLVVTALWSLPGLSLGDEPSQRAIPVRVDEHVELLSVVFRLSGASEYSRTSSTVPYAKEVDEHFGPFREHEVVKLARKLRQERGIGYDAVASFALHVQGKPRLEPKMSFDLAAASLEKRWSPQSASEFLGALQRFADDSGAFAFFEAHHELYAQSAERLAKELAKRPYRQWLDNFFGSKPGAKFSAIVGMLNGGANYGTKVRYADGREEIMPILGASKFDASGLPVFDNQTAGLAAHEFCHSYCNPLVDRFADKLIPPAEKIYPHRANLLKIQAYPNPRIMLYESLVRACTHRFLCAHGTPAEAAAELREEVGRGFFWTPELSQLLLSYERSRQKYTTFEAFMPSVVRFFEELGGSIDDRMNRFPHVVRLTPANGATEVDPALTELLIEFDRPMNRQGHSLVGNPAAMPTMPEKGHFSADAKTFVQPMKLEPGKTYTFSLNHIFYSGFCSAEGLLPLDSVPVRFSTAKTKDR